MVHGDFHPGQMMWGRASKKLVIIDWEFCGFSNPAVDLTYFMMQVDIERRRELEE